MALPDLGTLCLPLPDFERLCIPFPGGVEICVQDIQSLDPSEWVNKLLQAVNAALAPLAPIFNIIECLIALVACVKAIQKALASFPPRPDKLAACFPQLARALAKLLKLIPQLSIPALIGALIEAITLLLTGIRNQLLAIIRKTLRVLRAQTRAAALPSVQLATVLDCAQADLDAYLKNMNSGMQPLGRLINILNFFLQLAGLDPLPDIASLGQDAQAALAPLDSTIANLTKLRKAFP